MSSDFTKEVLMKFLPTQVSWIQCKYLQSNFIHSQISQSDRLQKSYHEKSAAHYKCRNADLNFILVQAMTNGFTFQIINSLMKSWGVRLTCLDYKTHSATDCYGLRWLCDWWSLRAMVGHPLPGTMEVKSVGTFPVILVKLVTPPLPLQTKLILSTMGGNECFL